jgi:stress-induced-phosphoprotein 1
LTNGIMRDERVFHIDSNDWVSQYNLQSAFSFVCVLRFGVLDDGYFAVRFEATRVQAWIDDGADKVKYEAQMRLRAKGWSDVRPALATTVRCAELSFVLNFA